MMGQRGAPGMRTSGVIAMLTDYRAMTAGHTNVRHATRGSSAFPWGQLDPPSYRLNRRTTRPQKES